MLRINNRGFKRSYVDGGSGIFSTIANVAASLLPVGKEIVKKGALEDGKKLGEKGVQKLLSLISKSRDKPSGLTSKSEDILIKHIKFPSELTSKSEDPKSPPGLTSKSQNILQKYTAPPPPPPPPSEEVFNLNALIDGSAIRIEDYIKRWK